MARTKVKLNRRGVLAILNDPRVTDHVEDVAGRVLDAAVASAPVDTGDYQASLMIERAKPWDRTVVRVIANSAHSMGVEARTGNLARALSAAKT